MMVRMTATSRKTLKTSIVAGATALIASAFTPAASADAVDDMLAKMPSGPISCEQANKYWTSEADFQSKKKQALAVATFHPRGGEIRAAIGRIDEAANRCGLRGTTGSKPSAPKPAPKPSAPKQNTTAPKPAPKKPVQRSTKPVYKVFVSPGMPTFDVPVANVATVRLPDVAEMAQDALKNSGVSLPKGSSLPF